ncbi:Hpt domain-containing protein [Terricaulis sp.]|uniref:Hpt domain-containing protein n=1 Tax=Terricaulis sp. TaxID=2768686 RepID=UPI002AC48FD0|nr:Hpt domain-containing protein [Terricaulis sp.]MDZ4690086.1 Hpt domain-containing protein [Terricaulis sp.]
MILDRTHFDMMTGSDRALQIEVLSLFRMQVEGWTNAIAGAADWRAAVHTMKGSARGIGLTALATACEHAESTPDTERAGALEHVRAALAEALNALEQFAAEAA